MSVKVPTGFENIGNTCFANSVMQCLMHTSEMMSVIQKFKRWADEVGSEDEALACSPEITSARNNRQRRAVTMKTGSKHPEYWCVFCGVKAIIEETEGVRDQPVLPLGLKDVINKVFGEEVTFGSQQDAHEFLIMLLHSLETSQCLQAANNKEQDDEYHFTFKTIEDDLQLNEVFEGSFTSKISCDECKYNTKTEQKFMDINLVSTTYLTYTFQQRITSNYLPIIQIFYWLLGVLIIFITIKN